jgi:cytidylate kinase
MNKIIINGRACSGKDTFADYLVEKYGYKKISFSDPIYKIAREYFGMTTKNRTLLQAIGQKLREIDPDVWVRAAFREADNYKKVVICDCRQANEYLMAQKKGYIPFRIHSSLEDRIIRCVKRDNIYPKLDEWENESETGADNFPYHEISNHGTKEELYSLIDYLMKNGVVYETENRN